MARKPFGHELKLRPIKVEFAGWKTAKGAAEGNNAAWECACGERLLGRCYYQFGDTCYTKCEECGRVPELVWPWTVRYEFCVRPVLVTSK